MSLPQRASNEEKLKAFDSVPLFMRSLPDEGVDDTAISALQSLAHEGSPNEIAGNFKDQGNNYFKGKRYREALGFYTQGVDAKPTDPALEEALLCNRAACNLELKNHGSVLRDCSKAISLNPRSSKAFYRSALALMALDRPEEALDCCNRCLSFDDANQAVRALRDRALKVSLAKAEKERKKLEKARKEQEKEQRLRQAFKERGLIVVNHSSGSSDNEYEPHFNDEGDGPNVSLVLPVLFLYPQHAQSDIVPNFNEDATFGDQLACMFPPQAPAPEWDAKQQYVVGKLAVYAITQSKRLLKLGMKMTLRVVFTAAKTKDGKADGLEIRDGYLTVVVLPKGEVEQEWVNEFKRSRDRGELQNSDIRF